MGKKIYTGAQRAAKRAVEDAYTDYRNAKTDLKREIEEELEQRLQAKLYNVSRRANEAIKAGVTKTDIKVAVRNGNWDSLMKLLKMTVHEFGNSVVETVLYSFAALPNHPTMWVTSADVRDETSGIVYRPFANPDGKYVQWRIAGELESTQRLPLPLAETAPGWLVWLYEQDEWIEATEEIAKPKEEE